MYEKELLESSWKVLTMKQILRKADYLTRSLKDQFLIHKKRTKAIFNII